MSSTSRFALSTRTGLAMPRALMILGVLVVVVPTTATGWWFFDTAAGMGGHHAMMSMPSLLHWAMWTVPLGLVVVALGSYRLRLATMARFGSLTTPEKRRPAAAVVVLALAYTMIIDISKTSSLGFVIPGMKREYDLTTAQVSLLPVVALTGATLASFLGGWLTDRFGTRTMLIFSALGFTGTALCGMMPSYTGNLVMCFLMGATVGALVPVVFSLLAWLLPARRVAPVGALLAGLGAAGGYVVASSLAAWLMPEFGWRALWLSGAFSGPLMLIACLLIPNWIPRAERVRPHADVARAAGDRRLAARRTSLTVYGLLAGVISLGYLTWLPSLVREAGLSGQGTDRLLSMNAWLTLPIVVALALALTRWHLGPCLAAVAAGAAVFVPLSAAAVTLRWSGLMLTIAVGGVILVANAMVVAILSVASTWYDSAEGATGLGVVAGASKFGGLVGPPLVGVAAGASSTFILVAAGLGVGTLGSGLFLRRVMPSTAGRSTPAVVPSPVPVLTGAAAGPPSTT